MSQAIQFKFDDNQVRVIDLAGEPWFIAKEVSEILGYSDAFEMTKKLDDDERQNRQIAGFGNRGVTIINEAGLYSCILTSQKPEAKRFKRWVTHEVLPAIRKTGQYLEERRRLRHAAASTYKVMSQILLLRKKKEGKEIKQHHFMNEAKLINGVMTGKFAALNRDQLSSQELDLLAELELQNSILIADGIDYQDRKGQLQSFIALRLESAKPNNILQ